MPFDEDRPPRQLVATRHTTSQLHRGPEKQAQISTPLERAYAKKMEHLVN